MTDSVEKAKELLAKDIQGRFFTTRECINTIKDLIGEVQKLKAEVLHQKTDYDLLVDKYKENEK